MAEHCLLCRKPPDIAFGEFLRGKKSGYHYLCLLLSPALYQKGAEDNGLYGFLERDCVKEQKRIHKQRCCFCKTPHANVSCVIKECSRSFHIGCGVMNECQYRLTDFQTFCPTHRTLEKEKNHTETEICAICGDDMGEYRYNESIYADCCKGKWFHRGCLVQMADSAGYFFRCPICKNYETFWKQVMEQGIFVPERDAAWELEPNAYADQLERPKYCSAKHCKSTKGRKYSPQDATVWTMVYCQGCGGESIHRPCLVGEATNFFCDTCSVVPPKPVNSQEEDGNSAMDESSQETQEPMREFSIVLCDVRQLQRPVNTKLIPAPPQISVKGNNDISRIPVSTDTIPPVRSPVLPPSERNVYESPHVDSPNMISPIAASLLLRYEFLGEDAPLPVPGASSSSHLLRNEFLEEYSLPERASSGDTSQLEYRSMSQNQLPRPSSSLKRYNLETENLPTKRQKMNEPRAGPMKQSKIDSFFNRN